MIYTNFLHEDGGQSDDEEGDVVDEGDHEDESDNETDQEQQVNDIEGLVKSVQLIDSENEAFPLNDKELSEFSYKENDSEFPETTNASSTTIPSKCQSPSASSTSKSTLDCQKAHSQIDTKLGNNIARILGETADVYQLDQARKNLKSHPTSDFYKNKYEDILVQMQTKILAQLRLLKKEHSTWEKEYCLKNDFHEPDLSDVRKDKRGFTNIFYQHRFKIRHGAFPGLTLSRNSKCGKRDLQHTYKCIPGVSTPSF